MSVGKRGLCDLWTNLLTAECLAGLPQRLEGDRQGGHGKP
jgi:hypothetical protein